MVDRQVYYGALEYARGIGHDTSFMGRPHWRITGIFPASWASKIIDSSHQEGDPLAVFCHHREVHGLLRDGLASYRPVSIMGEQSAGERQEAIDDFAGGRTKLIVASMHAGGEGIDLSAARRAVVAELDWSPAMHWQAEDRLIHRDKREPTFIYYLEGRGTYDERMSDILVGKGREIRRLLRGAPEDHVSMAERAKEIVLMTERRAADARPKNRA